MKREVRSWWETLAEQYEWWADNPKELDHNYSCDLLDYDVREGNFFPQWGDACLHLRHLWLVGGYSDSWSLPAGSTFEPERLERVVDFCQWMAEYIREECLGE